MRFHDKIAVVSGGANGIGRCIAEAFLSEGARVAMVDIDREAGAELQRRFSAERLLFLPGDIAEQSVLQRFASEVLLRFGAIDYLINNACLSKRGLLSDCSYDDFLDVLRIGVAAPYELSRLFRASFRSGAAIVNISSTRDSQSQADTESYTAAKGGIRALTHALSVSLAPDVRVNSVSPGWIETAMYHRGAETPSYSRGDTAQHTVGRVGLPEDIAKAVLFLCSSEASFINGENIAVDGGMSKLMIYHDDHGWSYDPTE